MAVFISIAPNAVVEPLSDPPPASSKATQFIVASDGDLDATTEGDPNSA